MEDYVAEVGRGGCCGGGRKRRLAKLVNYNLTLSPTKGNGKTTTVDLRDVKKISFMEDGMFEISLGDNRRIRLMSSKLNQWKNQFEVYNGREKQWSPIPMPVAYRSSTEKCLAFLMKYGVETEGLFRIAASVDKIQELFFKLVAEDADLQDDLDPHVVGGTLKKLLRDMPETLLTNKFYSFLTGSTPPPGDKEVAACVQSLPPSNRDLLHSLFELLVTLSKNTNTTKMDMATLGICVNPTLGRKDRSIIENMNDSLQPLFLHYEKLFGYAAPKPEGEVPLPTSNPRMDFPRPSTATLPKKPSSVKLPPKKKSQKATPAAIPEGGGDGDTLMDFPDLDNEMGKGVPYHRHDDEDQVSRGSSFGSKNKSNGAEEDTLAAAAAEALPVINNQSCSSDNSEDAAAAAPQDGDSTDAAAAALDAVAAAVTAEPSSDVGDPDGLKSNVVQDEQQQQGTEQPSQAQELTDANTTDVTES